MLRPVFVLLAGTLAASCRGVEGDAARFEDMARYVADIPVDGAVSQPSAPASTKTASTTTTASAADIGLRPAFSTDPARPTALTVEVMDPHELWDARDGLRRPAAAAAPVIEQAVNRVAAAAPRTVRPEVKPMTAPSRGPRTTIQLGAYSSVEAARSAWEGARDGRARAALSGLTPDFETVQVKGRSLVRLRVSAPAATAAAICRAAEVADPWCTAGA